MAIHPTQANGVKKMIFTPIIAFTRWFGCHFPETLVRVRYYVRFKKCLNLKDPQTLNEKILYLSLRTDTTLWSRLADKHAVREWVKERGLEDILIPQYLYIRNGEKLNEDLLPEGGFVLKTTHGCGDVMICHDRRIFDVDEAMAFFAPYLKRPYGALEGARHYMRIVPGLVAEKLVKNGESDLKYSSSIIDYKFWCFNGKVYYCMVCSNRTDTSVDFQIYDTEWNAHPEYIVESSEHHIGAKLPKPRNYAKMLDVCRTLSKGFPCVRVDLYNLDGKIYFGEMTFTSLGGMMDYYTNEFQKLAGSKIII